ncbi:MAG: SDR family oxidoreductase [Myxococcales bacterium]|nr:SDR family oxidoreductase [Myxococcales bacterium]
MASKRHVVITGASSGIGESLARAFAARGDDLTLVARRGERLETLAVELRGKGVRVHTVEKDLSEVETATDFLLPAEAVLGPVDVLVNNAGVQRLGVFAEASVEEVEAQLRLNLLTPLRLSRAVLPGMISRGRGVLVDVVSLGALAPTPYMAAYCASKAGLAAASEALHGELRGTGVHILTVYPGPVDTAMGQSAYAAYGQTLAVRATPTGRPEVLALKILSAMDRRVGRLIYPRVYTLSRWFPGLTRFLLDRFTPKPRVG